MNRPYNPLVSFDKFRPSGEGGYRPLVVSQSNHERGAYWLPIT